MDAGKKILLDLFTGSLRFVVPVYQRRYSWVVPEGLRT